MWCDAVLVAVVDGHNDAGEPFVADSDDNCADDHDSDYGDEERLCSWCGNNNNNEPKGHKRKQILAEFCFQKRANASHRAVWRSNTRQMCVVYDDTHRCVQNDTFILRFNRWQIVPYYSFHGGDCRGGVDGDDGNHDDDNVDYDSDYDEEGNNGNDSG